MFISSPFSTSSSLSSSNLSAFLAFRIQRTWYPHHHSLKLGSKSISGGSSSGQAFSQIFVMKQRTFLFFISCLFLLSLEITGQPQDAHGDSRGTLNNNRDAISSSPQPIAEYLHQQSVMISGRAENFHDQGIDLVDSDDITIFHQQLTTIAPLLIGNAIFHGNKSIEYSKENTASLVASSFRNVDNSQTQSTVGEEAISKTSQIHGQRRKSHQRSCDISKLKKCLDGLPPMNDTGIPSTPQAVDTACRIYNSGINCFDSWAKTCLHESHRQKVKASITGAHEMFSFLCKDPKFRADYLKHKDCYRKLSPHWDDCSRQFIDGLRRNTRHNMTAFCCIRLDFLTCVSKYSGYFCSREATNFLMKMAETLVRSSIRTRNRIPEYCINIQQKHCVSITDKAAQIMSSSSQFLAVYIPAICFLSVSFTFLMRTQL